MAWIESHQTLRDHPKTHRLAQELEVSVHAAIGLLHCLWWWSVDYAQDGDLGRYPKGELARGCLWEGGPEVLIEGLVAAGFVDQEGEHIRIHHWEQYTNRLVKANSAKHERGLKANHQRWHVDKGVTSPKCVFCFPELDDGSYTPSLEDSLRSPPGNPNGSPTGTPNGIHEESLRNPQGILPNQTYQHQGGTAAAAADEPGSGFVAKLVSAYEQNLGTVPPGLLKKIQEFEAEHQPSPAFGEDAVLEALAHNKKSWAYMQGILTRWCRDGQSGARNRATSGSGEAYDPGVEVEPGVFKRGKYLPYTDPGSPFYEKYKSDGPEEPT